ncbi:hypothetical protein SAMN05443428_12246 [Caloramator quimbayensis]|uniref:SGNH/GDSL hydrolase family protein n=1 Tax=Caloramator quimbayensis TaxID=1147123 RepID=A0A1T4Y674_9CLOT|nr:hypothetical protein [Caloramator quimbayensis]SKA96791.1 hypothetical protein SAMN05443428_12246 [Caloramator quimbayensis]
MIKKAFYKATAFSIILLTFVYFLGSVFTIKTDHGAKLYQGLYASKEQYDVVLMGSSHMNGTINPNVLWKEYGITSFNYATGGQPIDVTYYLLKEVLKKQKNPIVVVDLYYLGLIRNFGEEGYIRYVLDNMRPSINKYEAILNCTPRPHWISYVFRIIKYHSRWKELTEQDFYPDLNKTYYAKGFDAEHIIYGKDNTYNSKTNEVSNLPPKSYKYLYKIIEMSKKEGFKLVFINAPYDYNITNGTMIWHEKPAEMFNMVDKIAKENGIPFINYNNILDEIGFDFKNDMANGGHVNIYGADKVSLHLGKFLKDNYDLKDHRDDKNYENWNKDYEYYNQVRAAIQLRGEKDIKRYIELLNNENYALIVSCSDYKPLNIEDSLKSIGLNLKENYNYIAVLNNKSIDEKISKEKIAKDLTLDSAEIKIKTCSDDKNIPSIVIDDKEYANLSNGVNIVVYDKLLKKVVDSIFFDNDIMKKNRI